MDTILESVVVAVRVRPLSDKDSKENAFSIIKQLPHEPKILSAAGKGYAFDHVFNDACDQVTVFDDSVRPAVKKLCAGYNCAVIAYGQTGTGKTYTIGTDPKSCEPESAGIITLAIKEVISECEDSDTSVEISFMEIYNEEVYDLLISQPTKLVVQAFSVQNLTRVKVTTLEEAFHELEFGTSNRHTRATKLNAHSSRSHAIFTIYYQQKISDQTVLSRLDLVDLAGSEGVRHTGSRGVALNEANNINRGLLNLRNVISILSTNSKDYVPYRTSTLTTVLKDSLSRESYVTMIACISPSNLDAAQTVNTLRFAEEAKKVMSKPKIKILLEAYKRSNPQEFECIADMAPCIPPTPSKRNMYRINSTPISYRKPFTPLNVSNVTTLSAADSHDYFKRPYMNTLNESCSNSSVMSDFSTSTALDVSAALSPIVKKHMKQMEDHLKEEISTILRTELRRPSVYKMLPKDAEDKSSSPMTNKNDVNVQSIAEQTRTLLRNDFKKIFDDMKTFVQDEISQKSVQKTRNNMSVQQDVKEPLKNVRCKLAFVGGDSSKINDVSKDPEELNWSLLSTLDNEEPSISQVNTVKRFNGRSAHTAANEVHSFSALSIEDNLKDFESRKSIRRSLRIRNHMNSSSVRYTSSPKDESFNLSTLPTVRRSMRIVLKESIKDYQSPTSPTIVTRVQRKETLSVTVTENNTDELSELSPIRPSTVRRSIRLSMKSFNHADKTLEPSPKKLRKSMRLNNAEECNIDKTLETSPKRLRRSMRLSRAEQKDTSLNLSPKSLNIRRKRSARLLGKLPTYSEEAQERISSLRNVRKAAFKPVNVASPLLDCGSKTSVTARDKFRQKVLKILNGSLKDLTYLATVGSKTAVLIYNYRLLNDCKFKKLEDLKEIPGLPETYYERFMKANNLL